MNMLPRIYLDNAATSWPKPEAVYKAVDHYLRELGAPAGRSVYREAGQVERLLAEARRRVAELIGAEQPSRIIFTANGTDSLNLALHGILEAGDHVVTTVVEHNSVLRPLRWLEEHSGISVTRVGCDAQGIVDPAEIEAALRPDTKLIGLVHASNVTGALQRVEEVGKIAAERNLLYLVDAAQTLGHLPIDVKQLGASLVAAPGHKGLLGPLGVGILYIAPGVEEQLKPIRQGGTGTQSEDDRQPSSLPEKYETGNHNVPAILGLGEGVAFLQEKGVENVRREDQELSARLIEGLAPIDGVTLFGPAAGENRVGVISFTLASFDPQETASMLDSAFSIQVRSGLQCAPLMHKALGTFDSGGTVRISFGPFTTREHVDAAMDGIKEIASSGDL